MSKEPRSKDAKSKDLKPVEAEDKSKKRATVEDAILDLCAEVGPMKSICPTDAARAFSKARGEEDLAWRNWLHHVRSAAIGLARQGRLVIYRKGKPADPDDFRGVYRLGLPRID